MSDIKKLIKSALEKRLPVPEEKVLTTKGVLDWLRANNKKILSIGNVWRYHKNFPKEFPKLIRQLEKCDTCKISVPFVYKTRFLLMISCKNFSILIRVKNKMLGNLY